jgi:hypothetical protein
MGASTIWGPHEGRYLACRMQELMHAQDPRPISHVEEHRFMPGVRPADAFGVGFNSPLARPDEGLGNVLLNREKIPERALPWFEWDEPSQAESYERTVNRQVSIDTFEDGKWKPLLSGETGGVTTTEKPPESDQGANFLTIHLGRNRWAAIWLRPLFYPQTSGTFAFRVQTNGASHTSRPFGIRAGQPGPDKVE